MSFLLCVVNIEELYCFHYTASNEDLPKKSGWNKFDLQAEFARMGVPNDRWILTSINRDYEVLFYSFFSLNVNHFYNLKAFIQIVGRHFLHFSIKRRYTLGTRRLRVQNIL